MSRGSVHRFANSMEEQLRANDHKGGWANMTHQALYRRLREESSELWHAIQDHDTGAIIKEAADVGNFAMMISENERLNV